MVHRFLVIEIDGEDVIIDATFPGEPWDGSIVDGARVRAGTGLRVRR